MKNSRKIKGLLCIALALTIVFGCAGIACAKVTSASISVTRYSNTSGKVSVDVDFLQTASSCSAKIVLQEKYDGSWRTATGVPVTTAIIKKSNSDYIFGSYTFTLKKGKVYRAKVTFTDKHNTTTSSSTYYSSSF